jgi:3-methyladenine DNA glycosylase AlkD
MTGAQDVAAALAELSSASDASFLQRFFKTGTGQYGAGDVFLGVRVPATRAVARRFADLPLDDVDELLDSAVHEHRLAALIILVNRFEQASRPRDADLDLRHEIAGRYVNAVKRGRVNNWDLVDSSAPAILGGYLFDRPRDLLLDFAHSADLWQRRVAMLATLGFIIRGDASTTLELAETLLTDREDLIHKAVGWMLREVGKRIDRSLLTDFLEAHAARMPRTALSYATEQLTSAERSYFRSLRAQG